MTTLFELPDTLTVAVKDLGLLTFDTGNWQPDFLKNAVSHAIRLKIDSVRNKKVGTESGNFKTETEKRDAIDAAIKGLRDGEWSQRATAAATLDEKEKQLRALLKARFVKAGQKGTAADEMSRKADRWDLYRDLVIKKEIVDLAADAAELTNMLATIQQRTDTKRFALENKAENNAQVVLKMLEDSDDD